MRELPPQPPCHQGVADQLKQALLNLVLNAAEAMPNGGMLHVQTHRAHLSSGQEAIAIAITDISVGIPLGRLTRIFDGLHTTKKA